MVINICNCNFFSTDKPKHYNYRLKKVREIVAEYRRRNDSGTWHWYRNCSNWPTGLDIEIKYRKPTSGELCNECRSNK